MFTLVHWKEKGSNNFFSPEFLPFPPTFRCTPPDSLVASYLEAHDALLKRHPSLLPILSYALHLVRFPRMPFIPIPALSIVYIIKQFESCFSNIMHTLGTHEPFIKTIPYCPHPPPPPCMQLFRYFISSRRINGLLVVVYLGSMQPKTGHRGVAWGSSGQSDWSSS